MAKIPTDPTTPPPTAGHPEPSIDELRLRYDALHRRKIQAETQHDAARHRLEELKSEARQKYGTDDVASLQQKLEEMVRDNAAKRSRYQADLASIEQGLSDVERKFGEAGPSPDGGQSRR